MLRVHVLQRAAVLMHFDPRFVEALHDDARPRPSFLTPEESALLRRTDPRAFRTDPERPLRLISTLLEEYPVSCAIAGRDALLTFPSSSIFHGAIMRGRLVVDAFGDWLLPRAGAVSQIELAIALARRRRTRRGAGLARAPGVELARVPVGTLRFFTESRTSLGPLPHEAVARGERLVMPAESDALEDLVIEHSRSDVQQPGAASAGPTVAPCASALFSLLSFAREGRSRALLVEEARRLGADDDAEDVITGLLDEGLLAMSGADATSTEATPM